MIKGQGEHKGIAVRSNITHLNDAWHLVPGEVLKEFNDNNIYFRKEMTQKQWDEYLYYQPCANCKSKWKVGCC